MKTTMNTPPEFDFTPRRIPLGGWRKNTGTSQVRSHTNKFWRDHGKRFDPRALKRGLLDLFKKAGDSYMHSGTLFRAMEEAGLGNTVITSWMLNKLNVWGYLESKPKYYGEDPLTPDMAPVPYRGFQFQYRLKTHR